MKPTNEDGFDAKVSHHDSSSLISEATALEHFHAIVESSDDAIISKTTSGVITSWNSGAEALFGYSAQEMLGRTMLVLFPKDRKNEEALILKKIMAGEKVDHFETTRLHKTGKLLNVSVTISPIRDPHGNVVGASKIARDITQRKLAERQLLLNASVFTHTYEGIVITDENGVIVEVNDSFTRISGYTCDEVIGQTYQLFRSSQQGPEVIQEIKDALKNTGIYQGEAWSRRKDGRSLAGLVTINAIKSDDGKIQNYVALISDITSLHEKQERMEHLAHYDALTDLANRVLLADRMQQAMAMAIRNKHSLAILYLDLDNFKTINDSYGHDIGDQLLVEISHRMKNTIREADTLARIGGDEFIVLMCDVVSINEYRQLAERVLEACSEPTVIGASTLQISASIGMTVFPQDSVDAEQLIRHADSAMFVAKQTGKNSIHVFDSALDIQIQQRGLKLAEIKRALELNELVLYYQPKVNMRSGKVIGVEALIRWQHPSRGLLPPAEFLPIIESHPLQISVGWWVIETALAQMCIWNEIGMDFSVSVNVDAAQLQLPEFTKTIQELLQRYPKAEPKKLELEILETSDFNDIPLVTKVITECQSLGIQFSIDDFGTGYSSLTYLRYFPAETLKIDQSFIRGMLSDENDLAIVKGVIALSEAFKRKVIAEGVETDEIGQKLIQIGCDYAQGYAIAKPMHADLLQGWINHWKPFSNWSVC